MSESDLSARPAINPESDPWGTRMPRLSALFLAAVREALPQEAVSSVSIAYRYVDQTEVEPQIPRDCVRVEIIRI
jgi:hypothetical protein